jgi:3-dehydroquinate synthase
MTKKDTIVPIALPDHPYDIFVGHGLFERAGAMLAERFAGARFGIVTDENVAKAQLPRLEVALKEAGIDYDTIVVPAGESTKSYAHLTDVVNGLLAARLERGDLVIALGGGVVGDLAGFAAAITRRGMDFVQMPTSLLAQVDSSVGGKTGINTPFGKNLMGAFHQPRLVLADLDALETLPERQFRSGYAEVAKYGLIDDADFFFWLEANAGDVFAGGPSRAEAIARSCAAKARFVLADEKEAGVRSLLNLGHTFGHALEKATGYSDRLYHGEGVAIGTVLAYQFSAKLGLCPSQDAVRAQRHLQSVGLPTTLADIEGGLPPVDQLMDAIAQDKKVERGALTFILARGIGQSYIEKGVEPAAVKSFLEEKLGPSKD